MKILYALIAGIVIGCVSDVAFLWATGRGTSNETIVLSDEENDRENDRLMSRLLDRIPHRASRYANYRSQANGGESLRDRLRELSERPPLFRGSTHGREKLVEILGVDEPAAPSDVQIFAEFHHHGFRFQDYVFRMPDGVRVPVFVGSPGGTQPADGWPVMICIPGHGPGRVKPIALGVRAEGNRDYGLQALRAGFAVAVIEMRGQGSLRIAGKGAASGMSFDCTKTAAQWEAVGKPLAGQWVNDVSSVVSWLDTMPDFDGSRIGIVGQSLGGAVALYAGACDERIRCVITSGFFAPMADSCLDHNYHSCPACLPHGLREHFDLPDIAALIAPRSLMVIVGDRDVAPVDSIREGFAITRAVYHNRADCILSVNEGAHAFYPDGVWEFATDALD